MELRILTIDELRAQCNVDFTDDDNMLTMCGIAAEDAVFDSTRRTIDELTVRGYRERTGIDVDSVDDVPPGDWFPPRLKSAMLMMAAEMYKNREQTTVQAVNRLGTFDVLIKPYRRLC